MDASEQRASVRGVQGVKLTLRFLINIESIAEALILNRQKFRVQPRESKLRTEDKAQAHKSSSEFEIAALFQIITERQFQIQSYFYELEH